MDLDRHRRRWSLDGDAHRLADELDDVARVGADRIRSVRRLARQLRAYVLLTADPSDLVTTKRRALIDATSRDEVIRAELAGWSWWSRARVVAVFAWRLLRPGWGR